MEITDLEAYKRIKRKFIYGDFEEGNPSTMPIYCCTDGIKGWLTPGHYVGALSYSRIKFKDVPQEYRTRDFFLHALSGVYKDVLVYVKEHIGDEFDRDFFKDHIATQKEAIEFEENCFEYMPLEYIDEEMVSCAMLKAINSRYMERRGDFSEWFYSVAKRKPEVLTQDFWTLGARLFATKRSGTNNFLAITPEKYRTEEYYFAMCLANDTPVMEDFPENVLSTKFLVALINDNVNNIQSFSDEALERKVLLEGQNGEWALWKAAIMIDGYVAGNIPLNDERVEFFLEQYGKDSCEYRYGFKNAYKRYLRNKEKNQVSYKAQKDEAIHTAANIALFGAMAGMDLDTAIDLGNANLQAGVNHSVLLPIKYTGSVPKEFCKKYDQEEYLIEIYQKLGIEVLGEYDSYYYEVKLPQTFKVERDTYGNYCVKNSSDVIMIEYCDLGPFYDRSVYVREINISL